MDLTFIWRKVIPLSVEERILELGMSQYLHSAMLLSRVLNVKSPTSQLSVSLSTNRLMPRISSSFLLLLIALCLSSQSNQDSGKLLQQRAVIA